MKKLTTLMLACVLLCQLFIPAAALARQMEKGVPVWTEETVRQYALDYVGGKDMSRLYGYYDLQIRRYMPFSAYEAFLTDLEWMTGAFLELGEYSSFSEDHLQLKTHVLHFCMEKQDLDLYFTHKNKEDDWEVMALQFVPADKAERPSGVDMLVGDEGARQSGYTETEITVGPESAPLKGILTMPEEATQGIAVPACVLVHDRGALDMNSAMGSTVFFEDLAHALADMGVASIRYHKRSFAYGDSAQLTPWEEAADDAIDAGRLLKANGAIDQSRIVLIGHGLGATLAPGIMSQAGGVFTGMILIGGAPLAVEDVGLEQYDPIGLIKSMKLPTFIVQGAQDPVVSEDDGWRQYSESIGDGITFVSFKSFRGLNHLLMNDLNVGKDGQPQYQVQAKLDKAAGRSLAQWVLGLNQTAEEE